MVVRDTPEAPVRSERLQSLELFEPLLVEHDRVLRHAGTPIVHHVAKVVGGDRPEAGATVIRFPRSKELPDDAQVHRLHQIAKVAPGVPLRDRGQFREVDLP